MNPLDAFMTLINARMTSLGLPLKHRPNRFHPVDIRLIGDCCADLVSGLDPDCLITDPTHTVHWAVRKWIELSTLDYDD